LSAYEIALFFLKIIQTQYIIILRKNTQISSVFSTRENGWKNQSPRPA
jgi:hypothetical protein